MELGWENKRFNPNTIWEPSVTSFDLLNDPASFPTPSHINIRILTHFIVNSFVEG
jgi:hypothetical protein